MYSRRKCLCVTKKPTCKRILSDFYKFELTTEPQNIFSIAFYKVRVEICAPRGAARLAGVKNLHRHRSLFPAFQFFFCCNFKKLAFLLVLTLKNAIFSRFSFTVMGAKIIFILFGAYNQSNSNFCHLDDFKFLLFRCAFVFPLFSFLFKIWIKSNKIDIFFLND